MLYEGTIGQSVGIVSKSNYGSTSCMRTELYGVQQNAGITLFTLSQSSKLEVDTEMVPYYTNNISRIFIYLIYKYIVFVLPSLNSC